MQVVHTVQDLRNILSKEENTNRKVGFVPTMGALHAGHISLVKTAQKVSEIVVVSIFVNPTQFDKEEDLVKYPRVLDEDIALLTKNNTDVLFAPSVSEVYPKGLDTVVNLDLKGLDKSMEGQFRDGHFEGVMQVVKRLMDIVQPQYIVMGQKDFQQFSIIGYMIDELNLDVQLVVGKTLREEDGLAMSSRNRRLTKEFREVAPEISKTLKYVKRNLRKKSILELQSYAIRRLEKVGLKPEYFTIFDGHSLEEISSLEGHDFIIAATAAWAGGIRLIDNMPLRKPRRVRFM